MKTADPSLIVRLATTEADIVSAQRLRYRVFVEELGGQTDQTDHKNRLEIDKFDAEVNHLCLIDRNLEAQGSPDMVVGVYRLITQEHIQKLGHFYSENEFDLSRILNLPGSKLELGRSCIDPAYRGGAAMAMLWSVLGEYVLENKIKYLFGSASFQNTDIQSKRESLSYLFENHLMPEELRVNVLSEKQAKFTRIPQDQISKLDAMRGTPSLIKAYLRLGGALGDGAFLDEDFNTIDVFVFMDTEKMVHKYKAMYQ